MIQRFILIVATLFSIGIATPIYAQTSTPPATQNTITTTAPVSSETTISVGTLASEVLKWVLAVATTLLGAFGTRLIMKLSTKAGLDTDQVLSDQLNQTLINGLNRGAGNIEGQLVGKDSITIKNQVIKSAIQYAQDHRAETIQALGLDPKSGAAVEALKARIATLVTDPNKPTPAVLEPAKI